MPTPRSDGESVAAAGARKGLALVFLIATGALLLLAGPSLVSNYWLRVLCNIYMYISLAQGINIMAGYTGYPAFGNVVFFGVGGYSTAILMVKAQAPFALGLLTAICVCPLLVLVFGPPLLRLKGHYFAIATLGLNEALKEVVSNTGVLTGGGMGLSLPLPAGDVAYNTSMFYYLFLAAAIVSTWVTWEFSRRNIGLACRAIRDDEAKAEATGVFTTRSKTAAWMISATITGMAGSINAYWMAYIEPPAAFDMAIAVKAFVIFLLGGGATVFGPVVGAFFVEFLATFTWSNLLNWHLGAMGLMIMLIIMFCPNGFRDAMRELYPLRR